MLILFAFLVEGVFGGVVEVESVMEGDPVTLNPGVIKNHPDIVQWYFNDTRIALINGDPSTSCVYDGEGGRFRDRLKVDCETGSLTITDITTEHTGRYEAEHIKKNSSGKIEPLKRPSKCDSTKITTKSSNLGGIIKSISLTVSASKADKNENEPQKEQRNQKIDATVPGSGLSSAPVAGICVGAALLVALAVGVMIYRRRSFRNDMKKNEQESNDEKPNEERHMI
ncbi:hypothetical protein [Vibrio harveyi]|uniref:hypothetical protein n=1 Tax=Vibrio harveyi TaxID=669 RepID=UPI003CF66A2A